MPVLPALRRLLTVFVLNGIASAVPATLVLFFVQDRLQVPSNIEPVFLGSYFLSAVLSIPLWLQVVNRIGLALPGALLAGVTEASLQALSTAYCVLPCALKLLAADVLYSLIIRPVHSRKTP